MSRLTLLLLSVHIFLTVTQIFTAATAAEFRSWRWMDTPNARLEGHVIDSKMALSLLSCLSWCGLVRDGCRTVNHRIQDGACELNGIDDRWSSVLASPVFHSSFAYYRRMIPGRAQDVDGEHKNEPCHPDHIHLGDSCLEVVPGTSHGPNAARDLCDRRYGRLAVLDTAPLQSVLNMLGSYSGSGNYYIDIVRRADGLLVWGATNESTVGLPIWRSGQPDDDQNGLYGPEDCGSIEPDSATGVSNVLDIPCGWDGGYSGERGYICQYGLFVHLTW